MEAETGTIFLIYISAVYFFHVASILEKMGVSREKLSAHLKVDLNLPPNPKASFTVSQFNSLFEFSSEALNDPSIGLHTCEHFRISTLAGPSEILVFSKDLEESVVLTQRYGSLVHNLGFLHLEKFGPRDNKRAELTWISNFNEEERQKYCHLTEFVFGNYIVTINWLAWGFGKGIKKVTFQHEQIAPINEYERVFGCDVEFGAAENKVMLNEGLINMPLPSADRQKLALLRIKLEKFLASKNLESDLVIRVEQNIRETIDVRKPSLPLVASDLAMNERTLRRHLKDQGTNFAKILESTRKDLCNSYLDEKRSYSEIAQLLWYSEQSAFTRAYKKWHGETPNNHKRA